MARDGSVLVFVEVKARSGGSFGTPFESVTWKNGNALAQMAELILVLKQAGRRARAVSMWCRSSSSQSGRTVELVRGAFDMESGSGSSWPICEKIPSPAAGSSSRPNARSAPTTFRSKPSPSSPTTSVRSVKGTKTRRRPRFSRIATARPANTGGWDIRVVPNKFPALRVEGTLDREGEGLFDRMNGIGAHEVIIETPDHRRRWRRMPEPAIEKVFWAWRDRVLDLKRDIRLRHIVIFKNHGAAAGASLEHAHSQLIALPIVPREMARSWTAPGATISRKSAACSAT